MAAYYESARYRGDYIKGDTVRFRFNTENSGAPITFAGTPALAVYVGDSDTEITTGITLTVDADSRTGMHKVAIVTTDAAYTVATDFDVVVTQGTVNSQSIAGAVIASFSIENRLGIAQEVARTVFRAREVLFASGGGSSGNSGRSPSRAKDTIANAFAAATADAGNTVCALAGEYSLGTTPVVQPSGVHFVGAGRGATRISGTADLATSSQGVLFKSGSKTLSSDFSVSCTGAVTRGAIGFNAASPPSQAVARDFVLERVDAYGESDGLYIRESSDTTPAASYFQAWDCEFRSGYDPVMLYNNASLQADFARCRMISHGDDSLICRGFVVNRGTARLNDCQLVIDSEINIGLLSVSGVEVGITGTATTARLSMTNCGISQIYRETSGVTEVAYRVYDGGKLKLVNTVFDRSLTQTVSGSGSTASIIDDFALKPTTLGRTLDVTSTGAAGIDWGNVENKTTTNDLENTSMGTAFAVDLAAALAAIGDPVIYASGTGSTLDLYRADAYQNSEGRGITITKASGETHWPTTLSEVHFYCKPTADTVERVSGAASLSDIACTVTQATGSSQAFRLDLTSAQLDDLTATGTPWPYAFWFIANKSTNKATLRSGPMSVRKDPSA